MEWILGGEGTATEKIDGSCCAAIGGVFYKRYDAKRGKIPPTEGTYEAIGPHFRANPYGLGKDVIEKHGIRVFPDVPRDFEGIRDYLERHNIEGIVF